MSQIWKTLIAAAFALCLAGTAGAAEPVDINSADAKTLAAAIDGVGMKRAEAIVAYREANGPFQTVADLVDVRGIGTKTVEAAADNLVAN